MSEEENSDYNSSENEVIRTRKSRKVFIFINSVSQRQKKKKKKRKS